MLETALSYIDAGLSIIPIMPDGSKRPAVVRWKEYQSRRATGDEAQRWYCGPERGIAVIGGDVSGNLEILDFDAPSLFRPFVETCKSYGYGDILAECALARTPSGGWHIYYRADQPVDGNRKLAYVVHDVTNDVRRDLPDVSGGVFKVANVGGVWQYATANQHADAIAQQIDGAWKTIETGIETRGEGGYAIVPPSPACCHPAHREYKMRHGDLANLPVIGSDMRDILHGIASTLGDPLPFAKPEPRRQRAAQPLAGLSPGDDFDARGDIRELLERHGWSPLRSFGRIEQWRRPGKAHGVSATLGHCFSGETPLFYVFSTNALPLEGNEAYGPFRLYAMLEHGGDLSKAAKALYEQGYGERRSQTASRRGYAAATV